MKRYALLLAGIVVVAALYPPSAFAEEKYPDKFVVGFQGGVLRSSADFPGSHKAFSGRIYSYPFHSKGTALKRFSFGAEVGRSVLASTPIGDSAYALRIQSQLWFLSPEARYDVFRNDHFRATVQAGVFGIRRDVLQYDTGGRYGWQCVPRDYYYGGCISQKSAKSMAHGGISLAYRKAVGKDWGGNKRIFVAFPFEYVRYRGGLPPKISGGIELVFR